MAELKHVSLCKGQEGGEETERLVLCREEWGTVSEGHSCAHHHAALRHCDGLRRRRDGDAVAPCKLLNAVHVPHEVKGRWAPRQRPEH